MYAFTFERPAAQADAVKLAKAGLIEGFATAEAYEYAFHPREIKGPIMAAILAAGWNVRFGLF